jgi:hypothetical protein
VKPAVPVNTILFGANSKRQKERGARLHFRIGSSPSSGQVKVKFYIIAYLTKEQ